MILLRRLGSFLELGKFGLVLFEHLYKRLLFANLDLGLCLVRLCLLFNLFSLRLNLGVELVLDGLVLARLVFELLIHQLNLLLAFFLELLMLHLKIGCFLLYQCALFLRLPNVIRHLRANTTEVFLEV